jgi:predicted GIY-YIG superfamily endonuclease
MSRTTVIYLLHFDEPYPNGRHPRHYLGSTGRTQLEERLAEHRRGAGARLMAAVAAAGIGFVLARTWPGGRTEERRLKRRKNAPRQLCPICRQETTA